MIAAVGLKNAVIVEMDHAVLVCPKEKTQTVRDIVAFLKENHLITICRRTLGSILSEMQTKREIENLSQNIHQTEFCNKRLCSVWFKLSLLAIQPLMMEFPNQILRLHRSTEGDQ